MSHLYTLMNLAKIKHVRNEALCNSLIPSIENSDCLSFYPAYYITHNYQQTTKSSALHIIKNVT